MIPGGPGRTTLRVFVVLVALGLLPQAGSNLGSLHAGSKKERQRDLAARARADPNLLSIVDCLLPGPARRHDRRTRDVARRRPVRTTAAECEGQGGEYPALDQSDLATSLGIWLPQARAGDAQAQNLVGEIFQKGLGVPPDYAAAAIWHRKAALQGHSAAAVNLGFLYEKGLGVEQDPVEAFGWYRKAAGIVEPEEARVKFGSYHALIVGNGEYSHLPDRVNALEEAETFAELLGERYGFRSRLLINATRYDLLSELNALRANLKEKDNLLIYYAGHSELDPEIERCYWLPADAEQGSTENWISTSTIADHLSMIPAKQILVIADSCYSGTLTRSSLAGFPTDTFDEVRGPRQMVARRSRTALFSGGRQPVIEAGGGHSVFNTALRDALIENTEIMEARRLFLAVSARVADTDYVPIRFAGHETGGFFFVPSR